MFTSVPAMPARRRHGVGPFTSIVATVVLVLSVMAAMPADAVTGGHDVLVSDNPTNLTPHVLDGQVYDIEVVGDRMVVGGSFDQIQNPSGGPVLDQANLFAFDPDTGQIDTSFRPTVDNAVQSVAASADGNSAYIGGFFLNVNGQTRRRLAQVNLGNGSVTSFNPNPNSRVYEVVRRGNRLYAGGNFSRIGGQSRSLLAVLNADTGAVLPDVSHTFTDPWGGMGPGSVVSIRSLDVSPDGTRLVAVGNWGTVDGEDQDSIVQIDVGQSPSVLADWRTQRYAQHSCFSVFDTYMREVDFAPDGSYFVVATTGGGVRGTLCDTMTRWDLADTGTSVEPVWADASGGDTFLSAGPTGEVVYAGGHQRWMNNPFGRDFAGPGAVPREGIAALDPRNGLPLTWDPGRDRGVGVWDFLATDEGLYLTSDTEKIGRFEYHARVAMFPTQGGAPLPVDAPGPVPGTLMQGKQGATNPAFLYRVNAGGSALGATDGGPSWAADTSSDSPVRNSGSNVAGYGEVPRVDGTVPSSAPRALYSSERWDPGGDPEMMWHFPVDNGRQVEVRLYFANRYEGTSQPLQRVFDVSIDGDQVIDNLDLSADPGHDIGTMRSFTITSDGIVDIDLAHDVFENPLINGIEIVDRALLDDGFEATTSLQLTDFDGTTPTNPTTVSDGPDWSNARAMWMLSGDLYVAQSNGEVTRQSFDGSNFGASEVLDLYGLTNNEFPVSSLTGVAYDAVQARIYYTVEGQSTLYWRHFLPESGIFGAETFVAAGNVAGVDWAQVRGLHLDLASDTLFYGATDDNLRSMTFVGGSPQAATSQVLSGPDAGDGLEWGGSLSTYAGDDISLPNQAPTAVINADCDGVDCEFTSTGSGDSDGDIVSYEWDFGDGETATGPTTSHSFGEGSFQVTLTVTDDDGARGTTTEQLDFAGLPEAVIEASCVGLTCTFDGSGSSDAGEPVASYDWDFGDGQTSTDEAVVITYGEAGDYTVSLTVTDDENETDTVTQVVSVAELADAVAFVGSDSQTGQSGEFAVTVPGDVQPGDLLMTLVASSSPGLGDEEPTGVGAWSNQDTVLNGPATVSVWSRVADGSEAGETVMVDMEGSFVRADVTVAVWRGVDPSSPFVVSESAAESVWRTAHTTPEGVVSGDGAWVVSYWTDRSSETTSFTPPAGVTVRHEGHGSGPGHTSALLADSGGPVPAGDVGGLTATTNSPHRRSTMWTFALAPAE